MNLPPELVHVFPPVPLPTGCPGIVRKAIEVLLHHPGPVGMVELARQVKSSRFYLNRLFRKVMGKPPGQLHRQWRLALAAELLLAGKAACDVAAELEFADQAHFTRLFGKQFGTSPARYAKEH